MEKRIIISLIKIDVWDNEMMTVVDNLKGKCEKNRKEGFDFRRNETEYVVERENIILTSRGKQLKDLPMKIDWGGEKSQEQPIPVSIRS